MKSRVLDRTLVVIAVLGVVINVFNTVRVIYQEDLKSTYFIQLAVLTLFVLLAVFRKKVRHRTKVFVIFLIMCVAFVTGFDAFGYLAPAKIYIPIIPLFIAFVYSTNYAAYALGFYVLIYLGFGVYHTIGGGDLVINPTEYVNTPTSWILDIAIIGFSGAGILLIGKKYDRALHESNIQLEEYKGTLEVKVKEKTESLKEAFDELQEKNEEITQTLENLKNTQNQLIESEKMASLGVLTAGVAHEINNPLNFIQGGYAGLKKLFDEGKFGDDESVKELLDCVKEGIDRSQFIVSGLTDYSRKTENLNEDCEVEPTIETCLVFVESKYKDIEFKKDFNVGDLTIKGNVGRLYQAILNPLNNACYAVEGKGQIVVSANVVNEKLEIRIKDNGKGIPPDKLKRVLDPFYTTKPPGEGTGLGLSITHNIIKEHKGTLSLTSEEGEGIEVLIQLPIK